MKRLPQVGEEWVTGAGAAVKILAIDDPTIAQHRRRITVRSTIGGDNGAKSTLALNSFLCRYRLLGSTPGVKPRPPMAGEEWATDAGAQCVILDPGSPLVRRRERKVRAVITTSSSTLRVGDVMTPTLANLLRRWSRTEQKAVA